MSLQVRLRHALGERLVDLADRPAEQPLLVGRAREADVKIPSVAVAPDHCALFVHEGQWVLQDTSGGATFVNGHGMEGPTPLCIGDVITLGTDANPATIEIDPAGVAQGRSGHPAETRTPVSARAVAGASAGAARITPASPVSAGYAAQPSASPPPVMASPVAADDGWGALTAAADDPFAGWSQGGGGGTPGGAAETTNLRRKKAPKQSSEVALIGGICACVVIVVGTIWFAYNQTHKPPAIVPAAAPLTKQDGNQKQYDNIFDVGRPISVPAPAAGQPEKPAPRPVSPRPPKVEPPETPATPDPSSNPPPEADAATDKDWRDVEGASISNDIGAAILKFDDYKSRHPNEHTKDLTTYVDQAMDRLWWKRIVQLCNKRDKLTKDMRAKDKEIKEEPSVAFKKTLAGERKVIETDLGRIEEHLTTEMGYVSDGTPDPDNAAMMDKLSAERDASKFGAWKLRTLRFIRNNRGTTPWDGEG